MASVTEGKGYGSVWRSASRRAALMSSISMEGIRPASAPVVLMDPKGEKRLRR